MQRDELNKSFHIEKLNFFNNNQYFLNCDLLFKNPVYINDKKSVDDFIDKFVEFKNLTANTSYFSKLDKLSEEMSKIHSFYSSYDEQINQLKLNFNSMNDILINLEKQLNNFGI